jgi:multidrug resistance efflux pump
MTDSASPPDDGVVQPPTASVDPAKDGEKRPVVWMIIAGIAVVAAIGLGLWAVTVNSDLEASQSDLAAQTAATEAAEAQVAAQMEAAEAAAAELEKIDESNEIYVVSDEDVAQAESDAAAAQAALDEANAALAAAQDEASTLRAQLEQARAERDLARAERQQARLCARGSLGVISGLGAGDDQAAEEMETVSSACAASVPG